MIEDLKNIKADNRALRRFGISLSVVFLIWGLVTFFHKKDIYVLFFWLSPFLLISAFILPAILKPVYLLLTALFIVVSTLITYIILCIIFYLVITPMGLLAGILGKDLLRQRLYKDKNTY